jgi:DNA replication and repair protein RecF
VVAHLDPGRRAALFDEVARLAGQVWMTGADPAAFANLEAQAAVFEVSPGTAQRRKFSA